MISLICYHKNIYCKCQKSHHNTKRQNIYCKYQDVITIPKDKSKSPYSITAIPPTALIFSMIPLASSFVKPCLITTGTFSTSYFASLRVETQTRERSQFFYHFDLCSCIKLLQLHIKHCLLFLLLLCFSRYSFLFRSHTHPLSRNHLLFRKPQVFFECRTDSFPLLWRQCRYTLS